MPKIDEKTKFLIFLETDVPDIAARIEHWRKRILSNTTGIPWRERIVSAKNRMSRLQPLSNIFRIMRLYVGNKIKLFAGSS